MLEGLKGKNVAGTMKDVLKVAEDQQMNKVLSQANFFWQVRNGETALLWEDYWNENLCLSLQHKKLYQLSRLKEFTVAEVYKIWQKGSLKDDHLWSRRLRHWEEEEIIKLDGILSKLQFHSGADRLLWKGSRADYSVKKATQIMSHVSASVPWSFVWKIKIPQKIKLFLWKLHLNVLPTKSFILNRGVSVVTGIQCTLCDLMEETVNHLFVECSSAKRIWLHVCSWGLAPILHLKYIPSTRVGTFLKELSRRKFIRYGEQL